MIQAVCWVLIHSLWQGVLLALAGGGVILCTKRSAAAVRYRLLCGLSGLFLAGVGLTFFYEWAILSGGGEASDGSGIPMNWLGEWCSVHGYEVVAVWLVVAAGKSVRMAAGWSYLRRMRQEGLAAPALWVEKVNALSRQLGIRRTVKLVESVLVRVPVVIGQLKPIIYVPLGLINHLPAGEMEAVLVHELAHIRRYDYVVNMMQQAAECLLFFNPGFLWISSLLREERENSCDDIAIAHTRDRVEFVRALVRFKEHSLRGMALAFPGDRRQLLHRVLRISRQENKTLSGRERLILLGGCLVLLCLLAARVGTMKVEEKEVKVAVVGNTAVAPVQVELVSVLQARQQVAENMEWVQAQLDRLHRKGAVRKRGGRVKEQTEQNMEQVRQNEVQVKLNQDQDEKNRQQAVLDREQAERDGQQADRDRQQADRDREQAEKDRQQAEKDRQQAERDRQQAEKDRQQPERDRQQAEQKRQLYRLINTKN
jgi:beta-lactamase regulating signal transducer with metallopeptidase domain